MAAVLRLPASLVRPPTPVAPSCGQGSPTRAFLFRSWLCSGTDAWGRAAKDTVMTDDRAAKKAARDRMTRTGERYTAARRAERNMAAAAVPDEQPFFVALVPYHGIGAAADRASIRDARTGKVTALVPQVPGIPRFRAVTAAAGGLFYLTAGLPVRNGRAGTF